MTDKKDNRLTLRETLLVKILFTLMIIISGKSFRGGVDSEVREAITLLEKQVSETIVNLR